MTNAEIAAVFEEIADLLEFKGENAFRIRAYRNAARTVEGLVESLAGVRADAARKLGIRVDVFPARPGSKAMINALTEFVRRRQEEDD